MVKMSEDLICTKCNVKLYNRKSRKEYYCTVCGSEFGESGSIIISRDRVECPSCSNRTVHYKWGRDNYDVSYVAPFLTVIKRLKSKESSSLALSVIGRRLNFSLRRGYTNATVVVLNMIQIERC